MAQFGFDPRKAAQVASFFAIKNGGVINVLKLMKLMYLAEREHIKRYDIPMLFDKLISMRNGPALSDALNYINGEEESSQWSEFILDRDNHDVGIAQKDLKIIDLDELNQAELETLLDTWAAYGHMSKWELRDYTHRACPEWENPGDTSRIIPYERLLRYLGRDGSNLIADEIAAIRLVAKSLASASEIHPLAEDISSDPIWASERP